MTIRKLASLIALKEGKKSQASIGNIREILHVLAEMEADAAQLDPNNSDSPVNAILDQVKKILERRAKKVKRAK